MAASQFEPADLALTQADELAQLCLRQPASPSGVTNPPAELLDDLVGEPVDLDLAP